MEDLGWRVVGDDSSLDVMTRWLRTECRQPKHIMLVPDGHFFFSFDT